MLQLCDMSLTRCVNDIIIYNMQRGKAASASMGKERPFSRCRHGKDLRSYPAARIRAEGEADTWH